MEAQVLFLLCPFVPMPEDHHSHICGFGMLASPEYLPLTRAFQCFLSGHLSCH